MKKRPCPMLAALALSLVLAGAAFAADKATMAPGAARPPATAPSPVAAPVGAAAPAPDLRPLKLVVPPNLYAFDAMTPQNAIQVVVINSTPAPASAFQVKLTATFVNVPQTPTPASLTGTHTLGSGMTPNSTVSFAWPQAFTEKWLPGEYRLQVQVDPANQVKESDEKNNNAFFTFTVPLKPGAGSPTTGQKATTGTGVTSPSSAGQKKMLNPQPEPPMGPAVSPGLNPQPDPPMGPAVSPELNPQPEPPLPSGTNKLQQ